MQIFSPALFSSSGRSFRLSRYPVRANEDLRAWDAADEYILNHLAESDSSFAGQRILIVNDSFGGLSIPLATYREFEGASITVLSDSFLSQRGILHNCLENKVAVDALNIKATTDWLKTRVANETADMVLLKIPKSLAELEEQLYAIRSVVGPQTAVIAAGMTKSIHRSTLKLFEHIVGPTNTSLSVKKARLIFAESDELLVAQKNPFPRRFGLSKEVTNVDQQAKIVSHGGVFSHAGLDKGTEFLLHHLQLPSQPLDALDLGCGNGIIGLVTALRNPGSRVTFADESCWAVSSARQTVQATFGSLAVHGAVEELREHQFILTDCLEGIADQSQDLILNNPPFHQRGGQASHISETMFRGAKRVLRAGGALWVVGNRHLGYHSRLKKIFGNCELVASNPKFVVLRAEKPQL